MSKTARIDFRLPEELKRRFELAASYVGKTLSDFAVDALMRRAREVQEEHERTVISSRDREVFVAILDNEEPSDALRRSAEKYKSLVASGGLHVGDRTAGEPPR